MLRALRRRLNRVPQRHVSADFRARQPELADVIEQVMARNLTYLPGPALQDLAEVVQEADQAEMEGAVIEAGTALGGSAIVLARAKNAARPLLLYDVFGTIPQPSEKDDSDVQQRYRKIVSGQAAGIGGDLYYGYHDDLLHEVEQNIGSFDLDLGRDSIRLVKGKYQDTMPVSLPVAIAHIDCDWYDSVMTCLVGIGPSVVAGGRMVIDDYDAWSGARRAVDDFLGSPPGTRYRREHRTRLHLVATS